MPKNYLKGTSEDLVLRYMEYPGFPLYSPKNKNMSMNHFSIEEIKSRVEHYQLIADNLMKQFNRESFNRVKIEIYDTSGESEIFSAVKMPDFLEKKFREFLYDLIVHAVNERNKWQLIMDKGTGADPVVGSVKP